MPDKDLPQILHTADPTAAPVDGEAFGEMKGDENGILWIRPIATLVLGAQTSRDPDNDGIDPAVEDIVAFDVACFNYIWDETNSVWDRERRFAVADNMADPEARQVLSFLMGFDGATWDKLRTGAGDADGVTPETLGLLKILARNTIFNETNYDLERGNTEQTLFSLGARTATLNGADITNFNSRGGHFIVNVTSITATPSIEIVIQGKEPVGGAYYEILRTTPITDLTGIGLYVFKIYPGIVPITGGSASDILPRVFRVRVEAADTDSVTYSIAVALIL